MKYMLLLNLVAVVLLAMGCKSVSFGSKSEYKPNPEWSEERNQFAIEELRLNERVHKMRDWDNEDYMRRNGYSKH